ncbi:TonB-dependent receptor [Wenzhouxiangella sp. XN201]|uniref:TonB-dependent receptor n=1 Tax=Wenzhouxiangella sp. XN201 TaxID=2710755 RepID=UPI0013CABEA4|nr:TonB-dependent receptor [Wenzhouxiangella sp. XN201]NEZ04303.1 TonB-dependent receptor [Wenzhouxiangella sp. XN201]
MSAESSSESASSSDSSESASQTNEGQTSSGRSGRPADDSSDLETIVVTATKREQSLQDVPFSINAQSQADIERTGADSIEELSRNVAGLTIQNLGPGQSQVAIRGVSAGQIVRDQPGVKEQVGVYLDESVISLSLFTPDLDLFDLNRVETLRGPQGTLFGSGSIGGTIRYITNQPNLAQHEAAFEAEFNSIDEGGQGGHLKGMVNVPFGNGNGAFRLVGYHTEYGGYIDALREGGRVDNDVNSGSRSGIRAALTYEPTDNISLTPRLIYQEIETDGFNRQEVFNLYANPYTTERPAVTFDEREQFLLLDEEFGDEFMLADLTATVGFDGFDLTSVTSITERDILVSRDASALSGSVSVDLGYPDEAVMLPSNLRDTTDVEQFTQEVRLSSNGEGVFDWLVGAFYSDTERVYAQRLPTPGYDAFTDAVLGAGTSAAVANGFPADSPFNSDLPYDIEQLAIFGEASWYVTDRLTLTAGGRYYDFEEVRTITTGGLFAAGDTAVVDETSSDGFTPRVIADYKFNDFMSVNAQVSQGFRLGGVNDPLNVTLCTPEDLEIFGDFQDYDDETLWNYELGFKAQTRNVTFNAAVFHADIDDLQVTLDAGSCSSRISFNVPSAHSTGVEAELNWEPIDRLFLSFAGSVVEAEFDSTVFDADGNVLGGVQDGNRLPTVPEEQASLSGSYTFPVGWAGSAAEGFVTAAWQYIGSRYTQPGDQVPGAGDFAHGLPFAGMTGAEVTSLDLELPAYDIAYLSGGIDFGDYTVTLFVDNVFDENALLSFDRERGGRARLGFRTNQPRTYGINFRARF